MQSRRSFSGQQLSNIFWSPCSHLFWTSKLPKLTLINGFLLFIPTILTSSSSANGRRLSRALISSKKHTISSNSWLICCPLCTSFSTLLYSKEFNKSSSITLLMFSSGFIRSMLSPGFGTWFIQFFRPNSIPSSLFLFKPNSIKSKTPFKPNPIVLSLKKNVLLSRPIQSQLQLTTNLKSELNLKRSNQLSQSHSTLRKLIQTFPNLLWANFTHGIETLKQSLFLKQIISHN